MHYKTRAKPWFSGLANWIGHVWRRTCLLVHATEGKIVVMGSRGRRCKQLLDYFNPLTPNDRYRGCTAPLNSKVAFYIFIQQIQVLNILNMVYTPRVFLFKMHFVS
jgi:hypothetical protein